MKSLTLLCVLLSSALSICAQSFSSLLNQIGAVPAADRQKLLDGFFVSHPKVPVIENDSMVYFIYHGEASSAQVAGDATGWMPKLNMNRIEGTDYWYGKASYDNKGRLEYKLVINQKDWILDPLNKQIVVEGMGPNSELTMPGYVAPSWSEEVKDEVAGRCFDTIITSKFLHEDRPVRIYLPSGYKESNAKYPLVIFHDGFELFDRMHAKNIINNLISSKLIQPPVAVFVNPVHRDDEYSGNLQDNYTHFITEELIPFLDHQFRTITEPGSRTTIGISNGGNISLWLMVSHPDIFGKVAAMSSNVENNIDDQFTGVKCDSLNIYLNFGKYDIPVLVPRIQKLKQILDGKSCKYTYHEYPEGHSWKFWQKYLPEALEYLLPYTGK